VKVHYFTRKNLFDKTRKEMVTEEVFERYNRNEPFLLRYGKGVVLTIRSLGLVLVEDLD